MPAEAKQLHDWIGRQEARSDGLTARLAEAFDAMLDQEPRAYRAGDVAPLGVHWCIGNPAVRASGLGRDGHPKRQGFMPPVPLPRRMWAAGNLSFVAPLVVGAEVTRTSTIASLDSKQGRTGPLWFLGIDHAYSQGGRTCIAERQTIVYRDDPQPGGSRQDESRHDESRQDENRQGAAGEPGAEAGRAALTLVPNSTLLFRYSALTFNGHRIHYDRAYARDVEGYPDLVVHGPLVATLLLRAAAEAGRGRLEKFAYRALSPGFVDQSLSIALADDATGVTATATATSNGRAIMAATASYGPDATPPP